MIVSGGELITGDIPSSCIDHRLSVYKADISPCSGGHMYGSSFCMPLKVYLDLNGQNEACDSCAGEDYEFGIRVERAGHKIFYNKNMLIHESNVAFGEDTQNINVRYDPSLDPTECRTRLNYSGIPQFSHYLLYQAHNGPISVNPQFSLESYRNTLKFAIPDKDAVHPFTCERLDTL
jgi:hypothetical protein